MSFFSGLSPTARGKVIVAVNAGNLPAAAGNVTLVPMKSASAQAVSTDVTGGQVLYGWRCGLSADGTTVLPKYLPGSCRG